MRNLSERAARRVEISKLRMSAISRKHRNLASIADSLRRIAGALEDEDGAVVRAILLHATEMKGVARAINNVAHKQQSRGRGR
jgi:hypothetical protein